MNTLKKSVSVIKLIQDNFDKIKFNKTDGTLKDLSQLFDKQINLDGYSFNLNQISECDLTITFINHMEHFYAYDEDKNILYASLIPMYGDDAYNNLTYAIQNYFTEDDLFVHEFTHYLDWTSGNIKKFEPKTKVEYFNHPSEINAYINQGVFKTIMDEDTDKENFNLDRVVGFLHPEFVSLLTKENKKLAKDKINTILSELEVFK